MTGRKNVTEKKELVRGPLAHASGTVRVNRAPVLTLWAAVVAEQLGHSPETALVLGRFVAGSSARAKARRLGLEEDTPAEPGRRNERRGAAGEGAGTTAPKPCPGIVRLLGRDIPVLEGKGVLQAGDGERPVSAASVRAYVARAFGEHLPAVRTAMETLAGTLDPEELNRVGFRLYEHFRPEVPEGVTGWGAKGELRLDRIRGAAR